MAAFIAAQRAGHGIPHAVACRALGVSESWFYKWKDGDRSARRARRDRLKAEIARLFARRKGKDGSPRITAALREAGWTVSENTVAGLMAEMGLAARPKARRRGGTTGRARAAGGHRTWSGGTSARPPSTASGTATAPRSRPGRASCTWTACWTWARAGSSGSPSASTTTPAWPTARWPWRWRCAAVPVPGVIMHTDQGSEYTAGRFRAACQRLSIRQSMGRPGSALDNAVIESWHSTVEFELRRIEQFADKAAARAGVAAWIEDYNHERQALRAGHALPGGLRAGAGGKGRRVTAAGRCAAQA